ncbi:hypothetical protein [Pseudoclavibacter sp. AY1F1]|uniref:hypothetical protein n=1 Tax=Pseudoclavibacter sp. AY1F1 TaxID=2080583 RepID=UPI0011B04784|nr:hypothetical protein [Pseudoclavibacter sp. AY1F1]
MDSPRTPAESPRRALLHAAWAAPLIAVTVAAPASASSTTTGSLTWTWVPIASPFPGDLVAARFTVNSTLTGNAPVTFRAARQQGDAFLSSLTNAGGWTPGSVPAGIFERSTTVPAGESRGMTLGFEMPSGASVVFAATLTQAPGPELEPFVTVSRP